MSIAVINEFQFELGSHIQKCHKILFIILSKACWILTKAIQIKIWTKWKSIEQVMIFIAFFSKFLFAFFPKAFVEHILNSISIEFPCTERLKMNEKILVNLKIFHQIKYYLKLVSARDTIKHRNTKLFISILSRLQTKSSSWRASWTTAYLEH